MTEKAQAIEKRHTKQCKICMLLDTDSKEMKWHLYKIGYGTEDDSYVCNDCVEGIRDVRRQCHQKYENPGKKIFDGFMPWFVGQIPGLDKVFQAHNQ